MLIKRLEEKFRETGLDQSDCPCLLREITSTNEYSQLLSLIYMFGYSCREQPEVMNICDKYIRDPVPGLTAVCMRVVIDYWGKWQSYSDVLSKFLDLTIYEEWYDEVIFSASYVNRNRHFSFPTKILERFEKLISHPQAHHLVPLGKT